MIIDIIDDLPFTGTGLAREARRRGIDFTAGVIASDWVTFGERWAFRPGTVIVSAELADHVPIVLKVRALDRLNARPIVLVADESDAVRARLIEAGARSVVPRSAGMDTLTEELLRIELNPLRPRYSTRDPSGPNLTDRELQIAALFCGSAAPSATRLGQLLGLSPETIRVHLAHARRRYQERGHSVSTREELRYRLIADGWLLSTV